MPSVKTELCNLALSKLGISTFIADVDTEKSLEAQACRKWFDITLSYIEGMAIYTHNKTYKKLELISENAGNTLIGTLPIVCF